MSFECRCLTNISHVSVTCPLEEDFIRDLNTLYHVIEEAPIAQFPQTVVLLYDRPLREKASLPMSGEHALIYGHRFTLGNDSSYKCQDLAQLVEGTFLSEGVHWIRHFPCFGMLGEKRYVDLFDEEARKRFLAHIETQALAEQQEWVITQKREECS